MDRAHGQPLPRLASLGLWTDLWTLGPTTRIERAADALIVVSPDNPTFHWGNLVVFLRPMRPADADRGPRLFQQRVGRDPRVRHLTLAWDDPTGGTDGLAALEARGLEAERVNVLVRGAGAPEAGAASTPEGFELRALRGERDWSAALDLQAELRHEGQSEASYRAFRAPRNRAYRAMAEAGTGAWFGAFAGERLVADLGIFARQGVARFQAVETHPRWRRRGLASALVTEAGRFAAETLGARTLVIVADPEEDAIGLYRRLGFEDRETMVGVSMTDAAALRGDPP